MDKYTIKALRIIKEMTQKELAEVLGASESTIAAVETGRREVSSNLRVRINRHFDITTDILELAQRARKTDDLIFHFDNKNS